MHARYCVCVHKDNWAVPAWPSRRASTESAQRMRRHQIQVDVSRVREQPPAGLGARQASGDGALQLQPPATTSEDGTPGHPRHPCSASHSNSRKLQRVRVSRVLQSAPEVHGCLAPLGIAVATTLGSTATTPTRPADRVMLRTKAEHPEILSPSALV
jgi:hypothetical protein